MIFTIHFGGFPPIFGVPPISTPVKPHRPVGQLIGRSHSSIHMYNGGALSAGVQWRERGLSGFGIEDTQSGGLKKCLVVVATQRFLECSPRGNGPIY